MSKQKKGQVIHVDRLVVHAKNVEIIHDHHRRKKDHHKDHHHDHDHDHHKDHQHDHHKGRRDPWDFLWGRSRRDDWK